ncbi:MAG: dihydroneopterin aldolase [Chlorobi bacterium]|nr:dihydroneopterin aldolase [Chlorobiota bacterium]
MMTHHLAKLTIKNVHLYSYHGVLSEEQQLGGRYEIDVEIQYDAHHAATQDDLNIALDYTAVISTIAEMASSKRRHLIESLAADLADTLLARYPTVESVIVRVRKRTIPVEAIVDYVEVEWHARRQP